MDRRLLFFSACLSSLLFSLVLPLGTFASILIIALLVAFSGMRYGLLGTVVSAAFSALPFSNDSLSVYLSSVAIFRFTSIFIVLIVAALNIGIQFSFGVLLARALERWFPHKAIVARFKKNNNSA